MIKVKLSTPFPDWPLLRQTPGSKGEWGRCRFYLNDEIPECDYWVVYGGILAAEETKCPSGRTLFITTEPPSIKRYETDYLRQFDAVITCRQQLDHPALIFGQQGLPWMVGRRFVRGRFEAGYLKKYDDFKTIGSSVKRKLMSLVCSKKVGTAGHAKRQAFVNHLSNYYGQAIDIYGVGLRAIEDKWDAIAEYKYHIVIENSSLADYWTEKISDAYLGGAYPFYYGCPNLKEYFSERAFTFIDIDKPDDATKIIDRHIESNTYESSTRDLAAAKELVLDRYNLFALIASYCETREDVSPPEKKSIQPESAWTRPGGMFGRLKSIFDP